MKKFGILIFLLALVSLFTLPAAQQSGGAASGGAVSGGAPSGGGIPPAVSGGAPSGGSEQPETPVDPEPPVVIPDPEPETPQPEPPVVVPDPAAFQDLDCRDFETERDATMFFKGYMSIVKVDVHRLDSNKDGIVCPSLP